MKLKLLAVSVLVIAVAVAPIAVGAAPEGGVVACTQIRDGGITDALGNEIKLGYDQFGYNYTAHIFMGTFDSADRVMDGTYYGANGTLADDRLIMKWSDDWLSNEDCDGDGKLDRGTTGISLGWMTNMIVGDYDSDGNGTEDANYTRYLKIVYVGPGGNMWGQYRVILELVNDPKRGVGGLQYKIGAPGFGLRDHWIQ